MFEEIRLVDRPKVISDFFRDANTIDRHNHARQFELGLEKKWVTHDCYFCLTSTKLGIDVTDTWHLMHLHNLFPFPIMQRYNFTEDGKRCMPIRAFAGNLTAQLLNKAKEIEEEERTGHKKRKFDNAFLDGSDVQDDADIDINDNESIENTNDAKCDGLSFITNGGNEVKGCKVISTYKDGNGNLHTLCKFPVVQTGERKKKRSRVQPCKTCSKESMYFCFECMKSFCYCEKGKGHGRRCFIKHVPTRTSSRFGD